MNIEIDTKNKTLVYELLEKEIGKSSLSRGEVITIDDKIKVVYQGELIKLAVGEPSTIQLAITFVAGIASSYVGTWLYNKINGKAEKLRINYTEVEIDEGEITRVIDINIKK